MAYYMKYRIDLRAGRLVVAPTPKAMKSVSEVIVMAVPAWARAAGNRRSAGIVAGRVSRVWTMTNMSSMPMPRRRKGRTVWATQYENPIMEQMP